MTFTQKEEIPASSVQLPAATTSNGNLKVSIEESPILNVPTTDATANTVERDVVGNKTDSAIITVGATKSLVAYIKGIVNQVAAILTGQTDIKGTGFVKDTHSLVNIETLLATVQTQLTFQHQAPKNFSQDNPVQNQWYTVFDSTTDGNNVMLYCLQAKIATTGETIEVKMTIDGQVFTYPTGIAQTAGTNYAWYISQTNNLSVFGTGGSGNLILIGTPIQARSTKIEIRKITNAGNGTLSAILSWAKR